jgi:hypothetical protein
MWYHITTYEFHKPKNDLKLAKARHMAEAMSAIVSRKSPEIADDALGSRARSLFSSQFRVSAPAGLVKLAKNSVK